MAETEIQSQVAELQVTQDDEQHSREKLTRPPRKGSTRLPPFPMVHIVKPHVGKKPKIYYDQVPVLRKDIQERLFRIDRKEKYNNDYKRTFDDYWRMELDKMNNISYDNQRNMNAAIKVYLGQTKGSTSAINRLMKSTRYAATA